jgi:hypothetical protein
MVSDLDGNFLVLFGAGDYSERNLYVQKIASAGAPIGPNMPITKTPFYNSSDGPNSILQKNHADNILMSWYADIYSPVYTQRLSAELNAQGSPKQVFGGYSPSPKRLFAVSVNSVFNILLLWVDYNSTTYTDGKLLKAMIVNEQGGVVRDTLVVTNCPSNRSLNIGACSLDDKNNMLFVWSEYDTYAYDPRLNVKRVYADNGLSLKDSLTLDNLSARLQIITFGNKKAFVAWDAFDRIYSLALDDNVHASTPIQLHTFESYVNALGESLNAYSADVAGSTLVFVYESSKNRDTGYDIYANLQQVGQLSFGSTSPTAEYTASIYPNPTTQIASMQYVVTRQTNVSISVFNLLGQKIADVEDGARAPGTYTARFPIEYLASGVYFFVLHGTTIQSRKFIVIK